MYLFPPVLQDDPDLASTSTKCTQESNAVTEHLYIKVEPEVVDEEVNPMDLLTKTKRLMLCTSCGNLRLTN